MLICSVVSVSLWPHGLYSPCNSPGQNTGVGSLSILQRIFPTQRSHPGLQHCKWILYQLSHKGRPRILEWVAYPFSSRSSLIQKSNWGLLHCRQPLYHLSMREALDTICTYIYYIYICVCARPHQLCLTLCDPMDCSPPGSIFHGIFQARILDWVAMPFSRGSSQPRDWIPHLLQGWKVKVLKGRFFITSITWEAHIYLYTYLYSVIYICLKYF